MERDGVSGMNQKRTAEGFPDRNTPGDPRLLRSIQARTPKSTGTLHHVPGGVVVGAAVRRRPGDPPPFFARRIDAVESGFEVTLQPGMLIERSEDVDTLIHVPVIGATTMTTTPPPKLTMAAGDYACLHYTTDRWGAVGETVEVVAASAPSSTHHVPHDGTEGDYYIELFQLVATDGLTRAVPSMQSDYQHDRPPEGDTYKVTYWGVTGAVTNASPPAFVNVRDTDPLFEEWILRGIAYLTEPTGWDELTPTPSEYDVYSAYPVAAP